MATSTELATKKESTAVGPVRANATRFTDEQIAASSLHTDEDLPALAEAKAAPVPLSVEYWSASEEGESKRVWILGVEEREVLDVETAELKQVESVLFVEQTPDGMIKRFFCASRILVANIKDAIDRGEIIPGSRLTPIQITYVGERKNKRNASKKSKHFEILPLIVSVQ